MNMQLSKILAVIPCLICSVSAHEDHDIRLSGTNSNSTQGRVEISYNGSWGTVCDDQFEKKDAIVVCRQLGIGGDLSHAKPAPPSQFGSGSGIVLMDNVGCEGAETKLAYCQFPGWGQSNCDHDEDVGVICPSSTVSSFTNQPTKTPPTTKPPVIPDTGNCTTQDDNIRIIGPANLLGVGVVQIKHDNVWGGVCDNEWDILDARVVCRMLCFDPTKALSGGVAFDTSHLNEPMRVDNVQCTGNEASITDCSQSAWTENICQRSEMAKVTCVELNNAPPSRPEPLLNCSNGMLSASFSRTRDPFLEEKHLSVTLTYTGACNDVLETDSDFVTISVPFDECGTIRTSNDTHIFYKTVIKYLPTSSTGAISNANTYMVHAQCELSRGVVADKPFRPMTETVTQVAPGEFIVNMQFYRNNSFETAEAQFPLEIPLGEWLNTALQLTEVDENLILVVPNCYATPSGNKSDPVQYPLFTNKCVEDETVGFFPLNDTWFGYRYQSFRFVKFTEVYIHCEAYICENNDTNPQCDRSCFPATTTANPDNGRRKRSAGPQIVHVTSQAITASDTPNSESSPEHVRESSSIITRISSKPKVTSQSQTAKSEQVSNAPAEGGKTEPRVEEIFILGSGSSSIKSFFPSFSIILISFIFKYGLS